MYDNGTGIEEDTRCVGVDIRKGREGVLVTILIGVWMGNVMV